jgi:cytochrome c556
MVGLVDHAAHNLWDAEVEGQTPKSPQEWEIVAEHAIQMAAAGPAITAGGTGPDDRMWAASESWRAHAQRMSDAGVAAWNAARSENLEALRKANGELLNSCIACHREFKPDLPSEGIIHGHAHDTGN